MKPLVLLCKTKRSELTMRYIAVFNGLFRLTDKELILTTHIVNQYISLINQGLKEPFLSQMVFNSEGRKTLREVSGLTGQNLTNKLKRLQTKGVLLPNNSQFELDKRLIPKPEVTFKFELINEHPTGDS